MEKLLLPLSSSPWTVTNNSEFVLTVYREVQTGEHSRDIIEIGRLGPGESSTYPDRSSV